MAEDDLVDPVGVDARTRDDLGDDVCGERGRGLLRERPAEAADGGAQRFADDDFERHGGAFLGVAGGRHGRIAVG